MYYKKNILFQAGSRLSLVFSNTNIFFSNIYLEFPIVSNRTDHCFLYIFWMKLGWQMSFVEGLPFSLGKIFLFLVVHYVSAFILCFSHPCKTTWLRVSFLTSLSYRVFSVIFSDQDPTITSSLGTFFFFNFCFTLIHLVYDPYSDGNQRVQSGVLMM